MGVVVGVVDGVVGFVVGVVGSVAGVLGRVGDGSELRAKIKDKRIRFHDYRISIIVHSYN